jgi:predicted AlkP superfamily phosphohydrolase/phosphomutase
MFWRDRQDIIEGWYIKPDGMVGRLEKALLKREHTRLHIIIVFDHGFANFDYKVHLNRWLVEKDYLTSKSDGDPGSLKDVDWSRSQAYAIGLNSLYLNLAGREAQGIVKVNEIESITRKLCDELHSWEGPNGDPVVQRAYPRGESLSGSLVSYGPDILVGYSPGYRASQQTGLGNW